MHRALQKGSVEIVSQRLLPPGAHLVPDNATRVFKGIIFDVYQWQQQMFDGTSATFEMLKRPDTLKVIAIKHDKIIVVDQAQPNHAQFFDLPGGRHDVGGESELQATQRELREETGMTFKTWKLVDIVQPMPKIEQFVYVFVATGFENQADQKLDAGERITVLEKTFAEVVALVEHPSTRYLPKDLLDKAGSLEGLINLPEFQTDQATS